jgi:hypothetical protein
MSVTRAQRNPAELIAVATTSLRDIWSIASASAPSGSVLAFSRSRSLLPSLQGLVGKPGGAQ